MDEVRASYKAFLDSPGGKDLLQWLINKEVAAQLDGRTKVDIEGKALAMVKLNDAYEVRTYLDEMSKPAPGQKVRSTGPNQ